VYECLHGTKTNIVEVCGGIEELQRN